MGSEASTVGWFDQEMSHFVGGFQVSWGTEAAKMLSSPIKILDLSGATKIGERNQQRWRHNQEQRRAWQPKMRLDFFSNAPNFRSVIKLRMFTLVPGFGAFFCDSPSWDRSSPGLSMHATKAQRLHLLVPRRDNDRHKTQNLRFPGPKTLNHTHFKVRDLLPFALWNMKFKASTWACPSIGSYQKLRNIGVYSHFQPCPNIIWMVTSIIYPIDSNGKKLINSYYSNSNIQHHSTMVSHRSPHLLQKCHHALLNATILCSSAAEAKDFNHTTINFLRSTWVCLGQFNDNKQLK